MTRSSTLRRRSSFVNFRVREFRICSSSADLHSASGVLPFSSGHFQNTEPDSQIPHLRYLRPTFRKHYCFFQTWQVEWSSNLRGWVAQLVEQRIENPRVGGSIPSPATIFMERGLTICPDGWVAQLVEQRIENPRVGGSIPSPATMQQEADCGYSLLFLYLHPSCTTFRRRNRASPRTRPSFSSAPSAIAIKPPPLCTKLTGRTRTASVPPFMPMLMVAKIAGVGIKTDQVDQFSAAQRFGHLPGLRLV